MSRQKLILTALGGLIVALLLVVFAILSTIDVNQFKPEISAQVKAATGRELLIAGDLDLKISLSPKVVVDGISFANAEWGSREEMLSAKRLVAQVELMPLLTGGKIHITQLILQQPTLLLETDANGVGNWLFKPAERPSETDAAGGALPEIRNIKVEAARVTYIDGKSGEKREVVIDTLQAKASTLAAPLSLILKGSYNERQLELTASIDNIAALTANEPAPINLESTLDGRALSLKGTLTIDKGSKHYRLDPLELKAEGNQIQGSLALDMSQQPPLLKANLSSDQIDLRQFITDSDAAETTDTEETTAVKLFPSTPIPMEEMQQLNAEIVISSDKVLGAKFVLNNVKLNTALNRGVLKVEPLSMTVGGGQLETELVLNASRSAPTLSLKARGDSLNLGEMAAEIGASDVITDGITQIDIDVAGRGHSIAALMADLSGSALISIGKGRFSNKYANLAGADLLNQLLAALNPLAKSEPYTQLECAVINLTFNKGVSNYDKAIAAETDKMTVVSSGTINLGEETLDIGMVPKPRKDSIDLGIGAGDLVSAARIEGTFAKPELGLDAANTAKAGLKVYGAIATGGTSLLVGGLFDKVTADPHPCQTAMNKQPAEDGESGGGLVDSVKGLFGK